MASTATTEKPRIIRSSTRPDIQTINDLFLRVAESGRPDALLWQHATGSWHPLSADQVYSRVRALGKAFLDWGIRRGDRIGLLSENRWEWPITDFATLAIGAVDVPIYPTLTSGQVGELLRDSGCRIMVVSTEAQYNKVMAVAEGTALEHIVIMDDVPAAEHATPFASLIASADSNQSRDAVFDALVRSVQPAELATLIYTSGTTGEPKGVMLTHGNIASNTSLSTRDFGFTPQDSSISYLPLSHITARALDYAMFFSGAQVAYCTNFERLPETMKQVRPTVLVGVPRVYEKIRHGVEQKSAVSPMKKRILAWAVSEGSKHREAIGVGSRPASALWKLADKLVYSKIREAFGGRARIFISGGAPLGLETGNWFTSIGVQILEGYGLTETSPVIAINTPLSHRMGSVGHPLDNVECRIADDGELLVRGPGVFHGYFQKPQLTSECVDADGWFATGDIARIDEDNFLHITDRKKELLKTSGGKLIAPQPIESQLKTSVLVAQAAVVGDRHKFASVLISPNFAALEQWALREGIGPMSRAGLVDHPEVIALYSEIVARVNAKLANFETLKRFRIVPDEWTLDSGELTPSMKLKRRVITARYAKWIEDLYADEATAHGA